MNHAERLHAGGFQVHSVAKVTYIFCPDERCAWSRAVEDPTSLGKLLQAGKAHLKEPILDQDGAMLL